MTDADLTLLQRLLNEFRDMVETRLTALEAGVTAIREAAEDEAVLRIFHERRIGSLERAVARLARK